MGGFGLWFIVVGIVVFVLVLAYGFAGALKATIGTALLGYLIVALASGVMVSRTNYRLKVPGLSPSQAFTQASMGALRNPSAAIRALVLGEPFPGIPLRDPSLPSDVTQVGSVPNPMGVDSLIPVGVPNPELNGIPGGGSTGDSPADAQRIFVQLPRGSAGAQGGNAPYAEIQGGRNSVLRNEKSLFSKLLTYIGTFSSVAFLTVLISKGAIRKSIMVGAFVTAVVFIFNTFFWEMGFWGIIITIVLTLGASMYGWVRLIHTREKFKKLIQTMFLLDPDKDIRETQDINSTYRDLQEISVDAIPTPKKIREYGQPDVDEYWFGNEFESSRGLFGKSRKMKDHLIASKFVGMHTLVIGGTGAGKTSRILLPHAMQAIGKGCGLCFVTFKRDPAIAASVATWAEEHGKKFHYFSLNPHEASMGYNPLSNGSGGSLSARIISALDMPMDGDAGFYTAVQNQALTNILEWVRWEGKKTSAPPVSLQDVVRILENNRALSRIWKAVKGEQLPREMEQHLKGLGARLSRLVEGSDVISRLNVNEGIEVPKIMDEGNVIYFNLESNANPPLATAIGRMLMFDIREACSKRSEESYPFHLIIDEFQDVACDSLSDLIAKIRSAQVPLTLATQSLAQISNVSEEFMNTVLSVTAINIAMQQKNPDEIELFSRMSGSIRYNERQESISDGVDQTTRDDEDHHKGSGYAMEYTTAGRLAATKAFAIDPNIFLAMKEGTAVVFARGALAKICLFGYATNKWDMERRFEEEIKPKILREGVSADSQEDIPPWERKSSHPVIQDLLDQDSIPAWEKVQSKVPKVPQPTNTVPVPPKDEKMDAKDSGSNIGEIPGNEKKKPPVPFVETPSERPREAPESKREEPKQESPGKGKVTPPKKSPEKPKVPRVPQVPTLQEETEKTEKDPQEGGKEEPGGERESTQKEPKKRPKYASCDDEETANAMESLMG